MLRASHRIRRQLATTPGCVRFANIVVGPKEVWTLTVWRTRQEMLDFMRSGAHESIMWIFSTWLRSFWLMRWRPSTEETGDWRGLKMARPKALPAGRCAQTPEQKQALDAALDSLPRLRAASGPDGAASIDHAPGQRRARGMVAGAVGGTVRVEVKQIHDAVLVWRLLRRVRERLLSEEVALRCSFGASHAKTLYLLGLFRSEKTWRAFMVSPEMVELQKRWPDGTWTMRWDADNEFGHWDGMRLRRVKLGTMVEVPQAARAASGSPARQNPEGEPDRR